ncbi:hypothetical protein AQZ50_06585 [Novosphingobium sp. Fuku2-ISO-50]|nr:hypothetical protein AQZ50_06585 [Novosphingobium sp. Fuku2-ISO-50]
MFLRLPVNAGAFAAVAAPTQSGREQQMDIPELMSVAGFCARYCIGRTSFYREVAAGRLRIRKFGTATRVARVDAETWADSLPIREGDTA